MKAAVLKGPNSGIHFEDRDRPSPKRGEILIRVHACGVCHGDLMLQLGQFPFARYPIVPGHEIAGAIEEIAVSPFDLIMGRRRLMGSPAGSRKDLRDVLEFAAAHNLRPTVTGMPLEDAGRALKEMHEGKIRGRVVLVMK